MAAKKKPAAKPANDDRQMDLPPGVREAEADPAAKPKARPKAVGNNDDAVAGMYGEQATGRHNARAMDGTEPAPTKPAGVSLKAGSTYVAGQLLAKHGLEGGCPKELVTELATALGKEEKAQHGFDMRAAFHAIRGYLQAKGQLPKGLEAPTE